MWGLAGGMPQSQIHRHCAQDRVLKGLMVRLRIGRHIFCHFTKGCTENGGMGWRVRPRPPIWRLQEWMPSRAFWGRAQHVSR